MRHVPGQKCLLSLLANTITSIPLALVLRKLQNAPLQHIITRVTNAIPLAGWMQVAVRPQLPPRPWQGAARRRSAGSGGDHLSGAPPPGGRNPGCRARTAPLTRILPRSLPPTGWVAARLCRSITWSITKVETRRRPRGGSGNQFCNWMGGEVQWGVGAARAHFEPQTAWMQYALQ